MSKNKGDAKKAIYSQWAALQSSLKSALPSEMAGLARDAYVLGAEAAAIGVDIDVSSFVEAAGAKAIGANPPYQQAPTSTHILASHEVQATGEYQQMQPEQEPGCCGSMCTIM